VAVPVREERRPIRHDRVEVLAARRAVREVGHVPAAADDPGLLGVGLGVGPDGGDRAVAAALLAEVAFDEVHPAGDRVDVRVLEARGRSSRPARSTTRVRGPIQRGDVARGPNRDDPLARDGDRLGPRQCRLDGVDVASGQDEIGGGRLHARHGRTPRPAAIGQPDPRNIARRGERPAG
jgi:hypothetical protein